MTGSKTGRKRGKPIMLTTDHAGVIHKLRSIRYTVNSLRAQVSGVHSSIDGRTKTGKKIKGSIGEAHVALAVARDRLAAALKSLGDAPLEGDPE